MAAAILLVEDEVPLRRSVAIALRRAGHRVAETGGCAEAIAALDADVFDLVVVDVRLPDGDGLSVLAAMAERGIDAAALTVTAYGTIETAVEAMRRGAFDFVQKPFPPERLLACVGRALEHRRLRAELRRRGRIADGEPAPALVGDGPGMVEVRRLVAAAAAARTVLITGETGTGKDLVARAVHAAAGDPDAPFVVVNCGALSESLIESELFGHVRGAFTGAARARRGLLAEADGGTVFLDEIGEVPASIQPRLLRFLETGEVRAVGADQPARVDSRVVAATHRDLAAEVRAGRFRQDLLYRLDLFRIVVPPLRDRLEDLGPLAEHLLARIARRLRRPALRLGPGALDVLRAHSWPGNVRELEHVLERAALLAPGDRLPADLLHPRPPAVLPAAERTLADVERDHILATLEQTGGDRTAAARRLGISRSTLRRKLIEYGRWFPRPGEDDPE